MSAYETFGVRVIINAKGPSTRLSGGLMRPEVSAAMVEASLHCVDMEELQAAASKEIAAATGAESGYIASGASACLLLAAAACMTGIDIGRMARLPDTRGMNNEIIMVRSQRNFYDHAIRAAGATIVEVGLPDRYAGAGVRDAEIWEVEDAITERTAAIFYVADAAARPPLPAIVALARQRNIPVIVDAAAQLPPASNLHRFIAEGADLVAFSGGKVLGGPQASGFLCGRRDLIMSAALQHLDFDIHDDMWSPPTSLIDRSKLKGVPQHGIGRGCKAGKEEIIGLLTALRLFLAEGDQARHSRWMAVLEAIASELKNITAANITIEGSEDIDAVPLLVISLGGSAGKADKIIKRLIAGTPSIHADLARREENRVVINPLCIPRDSAAFIGKAIRAAIMHPA
jgi:D-glucosaminate-6-phosphate ammonia-lyase